MKADFPTPSAPIAAMLIVSIVGSGKAGLVSGADDAFRAYDSNVHYQLLTFVNRESLLRESMLRVNAYGDRQSETRFTIGEAVVPKVLNRLW